MMICYRAKNLSELPAAGDWIDSIYFSRDDIIDESDLFFARVEHAGDLTPLGLYTNSVTAPLPALKDGAYRVLVLVDSRALTSDAKRANNLGVSAQGVQVAMPGSCRDASPHRSTSPTQPSGRAKRRGVSRQSRLELNHFDRMMSRGDRTSIKLVSGSFGSWTKSLISIVQTLAS